MVASLLRNDREATNKSNRHILPNAMDDTKNGLFFSTKNASFLNN